MNPQMSESGHVRTNGTAVLNDNGTAGDTTDDFIDYTHDGSETTSDTFTYTISDGGLSDTATVEIDVSPINDPPVANDDSGAVAEGGSVAVDVLQNDSDPEGDTLSITGVTAPANGSAVIDDNGTAGDPTDDFIGRLVVAHDDEEKLTDDELLAAVNLLLLAGNETTTNLIGNGTLALLRNPDQLDKLRNRPELVETAVEEFLRYDGPVQATARVATERTEIGGKTIEPGELTMVILAAANRDPAQFPEPDTLDIERSPNDHVAFGEGLHFCLGAPLARAEGQIAFRSLLERMPELRLATEEPEWGGNFILRGLKSLPVAF